MAIVTGAGQGIGAAIAEAYAAQGAKVIVTGRPESKLEAVAGKIAAAGGTCIRSKRSPATRPTPKSPSPAPYPNGAGSIPWSTTPTPPPYLPSKTRRWRRTPTSISGPPSSARCSSCSCASRTCGAGRRLDHQHGLLLRTAQRAGLPRLFRQQGSDPFADPDRREGMGQAWHPREHHPAAPSPPSRSGIRGQRHLRSRAGQGRDGPVRRARGHRPTAVFLAADESNYVTGQTIGVDGGSTMF